MSTLREAAQNLSDGRAAFPIRVVYKDDQAGYAVHGWNAHSQRWQPIGMFHSVITGAQREQAELIDELAQLEIEGAAATQVYPGEWIATLRDYDLGSRQGLAQSAESALAELAMQRIGDR